MKMMDDDLTIFYNILHAIDKLHKLGIGHGDLKPENILINPNLFSERAINTCTLLA